MGVIVSPAEPGTGAPDPASNGLLAWTCDPLIAPSSASAGAAGTLYLNRVFPLPGTCSTVWFSIATPGSGASAGENWFSLFDQTGTLLAKAAADSAVTGTGLQSLTWIIPAKLTGAPLWVGVLFNASAMPQLDRSSTALQAAMNANLTASQYRTCTNGTSLTTPPATITPASNSNGGSLQPYWLALS